MSRVDAIQNMMAERFGNAGDEYPTRPQNLQMG
jgi:hypothetical protein